LVQFDFQNPFRNHKMMFPSAMVVHLFAGAHGAVHSVNFAPNTPMWTVGAGVSYEDLTIQLGDALKFRSYSDHDVVLLHTPSTGNHWEQCTMTGIAGDFTTIWSPAEFDSSTGPVDRLFMPPTCGDFYIACSMGAHCAFGQKMKVTVNGGECASPSENAACVTQSSKPSSASGSVHDVMPVANSNFWGMTGAYNAMTVNIGDTVVFRTIAAYHDVATVPSRDDFQSCTVSGVAVVAAWNGASNEISDSCSANAMCCPGTSCEMGADGMTVMYTWEADTAGDVFFICSIGDGRHCETGQKLVVTVNPAQQSSSSSNSASASRKCSRCSYSALIVSVLFLFRGQSGKLF